MNIKPGTLKQTTTPGNIHIEFDTPYTQEVDELIGKAIKNAQKPYRAEIKAKRDKRSLDANAYYWVLVGKIAEINRTSTAEIHNIMLCRYGTPMRRDGSIVGVRLSDDCDYLKEETLHVKPSDKVEEVKGKMYRWFFLMKGSSEYDTAEMSRLIDGTVSEAKELGIETMTPNELREIKERWGIE